MYKNHNEGIMTDVDKTFTSFDQDRITRIIESLNFTSVPTQFIIEYDIDERELVKRIVDDSLPGEPSAANVLSVAKTTSPLNEKEAFPKF